MTYKYEWIADGGKNSCKACTALHGTKYKSLADVPEKPHPNCKCMIKEITTGYPTYIGPHPWTGREAPKTLYGDPVYIDPQTGIREVQAAWDSVYNRHRPAGEKFNNLVEKERKALINNAIRKAKTSTWGFKADFDQKNVLIFDGAQLHHYENGIEKQSWRAESGKPGYQNPNNQSRKGLGPLPEGIYMARQQNYQKWEDASLVDKTLSEIPKSRLKRSWGAWPGGRKSWGEQRVWLDFPMENNMLGRNNFSAHGGTTPGSAGCLDLGKQMPGFAKWYEKNGKNLLIIVDYKAMKQAYQRLF